MAALSSLSIESMARSSEQQQRCIHCNSLDEALADATCRAEQSELIRIKLKQALNESNKKVTTAERELSATITRIRDESAAEMSRYRSVVDDRVQAVEENAIDAVARVEAKYAAMEAQVRAEAAATSSADITAAETQAAVAEERMAREIRACERRVADAIRIGEHRLQLMEQEVDTTKSRFEQQQADINKCNIERDKACANQVETARYAQALEARLSELETCLIDAQSNYKADILKERVHADTLSDEMENLRRQLHDAMELRAEASESGDRARSQISSLEEEIRRSSACVVQQQGLVDVLTTRLSEFQAVDALAVRELSGQVKFREEEAENLRKDLLVAQDEYRCLLEKYQILNDSFMHSKTVMDKNASLWAESIELFETEIALVGITITIPRTSHHKLDSSRDSNISTTSEDALAYVRQLITELISCINAEKETLKLQEERIQRSECVYEQSRQEIALIHEVLESERAGHVTVSSELSKLKNDSHAAAEHWRGEIASYKDRIEYSEAELLRANCLVNDANQSRYDSEQRCLRLRDLVVTMRDELFSIMHDTNGTDDNVMDHGDKNINTDDDSLLETSLNQYLNHLKSLLKHQTQESKSLRDEVNHSKAYIVNLRKETDEIVSNAEARHIASEKMTDAHITALKTEWEHRFAVATTNHENEILKYQEQLKGLTSELKKSKSATRIQMEAVDNANMKTSQAQQESFSAMKDMAAISKKLSDEQIRSHGAETTVCLLVRALQPFRIRVRELSFQKRLLASRVLRLQSLLHEVDEMASAIAGISSSTNSDTYNDGDKCNLPSAWLSLVSGPRLRWRRAVIAILAIGRFASRGKMRCELITPDLWEGDAPLVVRLHDPPAAWQDSQSLVVTVFDNVGHRLIERDTALQQLEDMHRFSKAPGFDIGILAPPQRASDALLFLRVLNALDPTFDETMYGSTNIVTYDETTVSTNILDRVRTTKKTLTQLLAGGTPTLSLTNSSGDRDEIIHGAKILSLLRQSLIGIANRLKNVEEDRDAMRVGCQRAVDECTRARSEIDVLQARIVDNAHQLKEHVALVNRTKELEEELKRQATHEQELVNEVLQLNMDISRSQNELRGRDKRLSEALAETNDLRSRCKKLDTALIDTQRILTSIVSDADEGKSRLRELELVIEDKEVKLTRISRENEIVVEQREDALSRLLDMASELENSNKILQDAIVARELAETHCLNADERSSELAMALHCATDELTTAHGLKQKLEDAVSQIEKMNHDLDLERRRNASLQHSYTAVSLKLDQRNSIDIQGSETELAKLSPKNRNARNVDLEQATKMVSPASTRLDNMSTTLAAELDMCLANLD